jgi:hypothetical protein
MNRLEGRHFGKLGAGIFLLAVGIIMMADRYDLFSIGNPWHLWPLIIIVIGTARLIESRHAWQVWKGCTMLFFGLWFLANELHLYGLTYSNSWPILLIGAGISILWKSFSPSAHKCETEVHDENR